MRKKIVVGLMFVFGHAIAEDGGSTIRIFEKDIRLPASCTLHARPSILDRHIMLSCDVTDSGGVVHLYIKPSEQCQNEIRRSEARLISRASVEGRELLVLRMELGSRSSNIWMVWDNEVCLTAISSLGEEHVTDILKPIWQ